jgi:hypothetical protein
MKKINVFIALTLAILMSVGVAFATQPQDPPGQNKEDQGWYVKINGANAGDQYQYFKSHPGSPSDWKYCGASLAECKGVEPPPGPPPVCENCPDGVSAISSIKASSVGNDLTVVKNLDNPNLEGGFGNLNAEGVAEIDANFYGAADGKILWIKIPKYAGAVIDANVDTKNLTGEVTFINEPDHLNVTTTSSNSIDTTVSGLGSSGFGSDYNWRTREYKCPATGFLSASLFGNAGSANYAQLYAEGEKFGVSILAQGEQGASYAGSASASDSGAATVVFLKGSGANAFSNGYSSVDLTKSIDDVAKTVTIGISALNKSYSGINSGINWVGGPNLVKSDDVYNLYGSGSVQSSISSINGTGSGAVGLFDVKYNYNVNPATLPATYGGMAYGNTQINLAPGSSHITTTTFSTVGPGVGQPIAVPTVK